jgi:uncharacterized phage protein gp47/JayE
MAGLTATIDSTGISAPDYPSVLAQLKASYRAIYGQDVYLEPDSQDGAFLALLAAAINDVNSVAVAVFNAFSPSFAVGEGLSRNVKINGLARNVPSRSTASLLVIGTAGTFIQDLIAVDANNNQWLVSGQTQIPPAGQILVTAICLTPGAVNASAGSISGIGNPTRGWQSVSNPAAASVGAPVETDAQLRIRQAASTANPSRTIVEGITGALLGLTGVTRVRGYENATSITDANGIGGYTIAYVVEGGADQDVGNTIAAKKTPGVLTQGTTSVTITNVYGLAGPIKFYRPSPMAHYVEVNISQLAGYTTAMTAAIIAAVAAYINTLPIGVPVRITRLVGIADGIDPSAYYVSSVRVGWTAGGLGTTDLPLLFNQVATVDPANITVNVV